MVISDKKIGFIMPDLALFGGPKRVVRIANILSKRGYSVKVYLDPKNKNVASWEKDFFFDTGCYDEIANDKNQFNFFLNPGYTDIKYINGSKADYDIIYIVCNDGSPRKFYTKWIESFRKNPKVLLAGNNGMWRANYDIEDYRCFDFIGGIDLKRYHKTDVKRCSKYFNIVIQGRISREWKGVQEIIRSIESLKSKEKIKLIIFNTEPLDIKTSLNIEEKIDVPQDRMKEVYSLGDLFVHFEDNTAGWSNTCAEAMACKMPVICTKYGTSDFAIHNETAYVIERDEKELAKAIKIMMKDKKLRDRLAASGHEKIKEFSWDNLVDEMEKVFDEMFSFKMINTPGRNSLPQKSLHIAFLTSEFVSEKKTWGGLGNYLNRITRSLKESGHIPEVFVISSEKPEVIDFNGIRVNRVSKKKNFFLGIVSVISKTLRLERGTVWGGPAAYLTYAYSLSKAFKRRHKEYPFDFVQSTNCHASGYFIPKMSDCTHLVRISSKRDLWFRLDGRQFSLGTRLMCRLERKSIRKADIAYAPSNFIAKKCKDDGWRGDVLVLRPPAFIETLSNGKVNCLPNR
jgi:glycosyltransferase involved in cell wall biosynthesis